MGSTTATFNSVRVGNDTFSLRFATDGEPTVEDDDEDDEDNDGDGDDNTASDDVDDPLHPRAVYQCGRCVAQFARSYQLKRHTFVEHSPLGAAVKERMELRMTNGPNSDDAQPESPVKQRKLTAGTVSARRPPNIATHPNKIVQRSTEHDAEHIEYIRMARTDAASGQRRYANQYQCRLCGDGAAVFDRLADVDEHLQLHNGTAFAYRCELCDEQLASLAVLRNHVHAHTCIGFPLRCQRCEQRFAGDDELLGHWCVGKKLLACLVCRLTFAGWPLLTAHQEWVHAGRRHFRCNECSAAFVHRTSLGIHQRIECDRGGVGKKV